VLKWALANGCPWNRASCRRFAAFMNQDDVVAWVDSLPLQ